MPALRATSSGSSGIALPHSDISLKGISYKSIYHVIYICYELYDNLTTTPIFSTLWTTILLEKYVPRVTAKSSFLLVLNTNSATHAVSGNANCNKPVVLAKRLPMKKSPQSARNVLEIQARLQMRGQPGGQGPMVLRMPEMHMTSMEMMIQRTETLRAQYRS